MLNDVLHFHFTISFKKWAKERKKMIPFLREKTGEKQNSATTMISVDGIVTIISNEVKITRESFKNILKVKNFLKNLINLIETNHQINMTSDHSV